MRCRRRAQPLSGQLRSLHQRGLLEEVIGATTDGRWKVQLILVAQQTRHDAGSLQAARQHIQPLRQAAAHIHLGDEP